MIPLTHAARAPRAPHQPKVAASTPPADDTTDQQQLLAIQRQQFDFQVESDAEALRERNALQELLLAQLKSDDEIVKKYIEMI